VVVENSLVLDIALGFGRLNTPAPVEVFRVYAHNWLPFTFPHIVVRWDRLQGIDIQKRTFLLLRNHDLAETLLEMSVEQVLILSIEPVVLQFKLLDSLLVALLYLNEG